MNAADLCRMAISGLAGDGGGGDPLAAARPVAPRSRGSEGIPARPVWSRARLDYQSIVSPGDPFNRALTTTWFVDDAIVDFSFSALGSNDVIHVDEASGGVSLGNSTRWDTLVLWVSKGNSNKDTFTWTVWIQNSVVGLARAYINLGAPVANIGRVWDMGPVASPRGGGLKIQLVGPVVPSASRIELDWSAFGWSTDSGAELPAPSGGKSLMPLAREQGNDNEIL